MIWFLSNLPLTLSLPRVNNSNFPCSLARDITSLSVKNLSFHSLYSDWNDYTINSHYIIYALILFERLWECIFWTWKCKGYKLASQQAAGVCSSEIIGRVRACLCSLRIARRQKSDSYFDPAANSYTPALIIYKTKCNLEASTFQRPISLQ